MQTAHRIGSQQDKLIRFLAIYVRATAEQCTRYSYSPNSLRHVRKYLTGLVEAGYLDANRGFSQNGKPPVVYSPSMKGWRYAEEQYGLPIPTRWRPSEAAITDFRDYLHDLALTDFGITLEHFCRAADPMVRFVRFVHDRMLPQTPVQLPDGTKRTRRLDGFVELRIRRGDPPRTKQRCFLVEIDRGTHYQKAIREKMLAQLAYVQGGHYQRDFGTQSLTYLWVCPGGSERVALLKGYLEAVLTEQRQTDYAQLFRLTGENPATVDPVNLFATGQSWYVPFQSDPITLLAMPPQTAVVRLERSHYLPQQAYDRFLAATGEAPSHVAAELDTE